MGSTPRRPFADHAESDILRGMADAVTTTGDPVDLAWRERQPGHLVRAGLALTAPVWMDERGHRKAVSRIPGTWRSAAEAWIEAVPLAGAIAPEVDP